MLRHKSVAECAVYFWKGLPASEMSGHVDCMNVWHFLVEHTEFTNVATNIPPILDDKVR